MATISTPRAQSPARQSLQSPTIPNSPPTTPSSSVHASLDLPRGDPRSASPAPAPNASQRRNRVALRDYYHLKSRPPPRAQASRTTSIASTASDGITFTLTAPEGTSGSSDFKSQLDEVDFDAEAYVQGLLKSSTLRTLLKAEGSLVSEIRNLDGERKALVYDNYSKLITVTQTLGTMQRKSMEEGDVDDEVAAGRGSLGSIGMLGPALDAVVKSAAELRKDNDADRDIARRRQQKRASLRQRRAQRETVRWALGTPARLQQCLEMGQREEAEAIWRDVQDVLDQWKDVQGTSDLRTRCEEIMSHKLPTVGPDG